MAITFKEAERIRKLAELIIDGQKLGFSENLIKHYQKELKELLPYDERIKLGVVI